MMDDRSDQGCMDGIGRPVHSTDCQSVVTITTTTPSACGAGAFLCLAFPPPARPAVSLSLAVRPSIGMSIDSARPLGPPDLRYHPVALRLRRRADTQPNPTHPSRSCVFACVSREMKSTSTTRVSALDRWLSRSSRIRRASICISIHPLASRVRGATLMPCPSQKAS